MSPDGFTYVFLPNDFLSGLFNSFGMQLPASFSNWKEANSTALLSQNDSFPTGANPKSWGRGGTRPTYVTLEKRLY
jgi:hypothetical protein